MKQGRQVIAFLSFLSGTHNLSAAFQNAQTFTRTHDISPSPPSMLLKSHVSTSFGRIIDEATSPISTSSTSLHNSYLDTLSDSSSSSTTGTKRVIDFSSLSKYIFAAGVQVGLFSLSFFTLDKVLERANMSVLPSPITWLLFYAISLRSRVFNPLNNQRPDSPKLKNRIMPKWTPPGVVFPILWLILIPSLRATSSTIIVNSLGRYLDVTILSLILHLTCGDIWNTITNIECRNGTSALANVFTYLSAVYASLSYGIINPTAGKLLGLTCVWLTIASALITQTWRLNKGADGKKDSLLPMKLKGEESPTKFWFQKNGMEGTD